MTKPMSTNKRRIVAKLIALSALFLLMGILLVLKRNQNVCEFFATTFSRAWIWLFGNIFGVIPFSLYELFLILAICGAVVFLVVIICRLAKHKWYGALSLFLAVAIAVVAFVNVYTATASFAYNRKPLPQEIYREYSSDEFTYAEAVQVATLLVDKLNAAYVQTEHDQDGNIVYPYDFREISNMLAKQYKKLNNPYFSAYTPRGKCIGNKWIMSQLHITGVFFAPFGEANVNGNENTMYLPSTLAHELAHGKGVMQEYQADIVAYYVTAQCDDPYISYGTLVVLTDAALGLLSQYPTLASQNQYPAEVCLQLASKINPGIRKELKNVANYWGQFTLFDKIGEFFNDLYLKLQKQEGGTDSYVRPGQSEGTGSVDDAGQEIMYVVHFSGTQNLVINMFKQGLLQKVA